MGCCACLGVPSVPPIVRRRRVPKQPWPGVSFQRLEVDEGAMKMPTNPVSTYLKYANLQMAAEAIFPIGFTQDAIPIATLTTGNKANARRLAGDALSDASAMQATRQTATSHVLLRYERDRGLGTLPVASRIERSAQAGAVSVPTDAYGAEACIESVWSEGAAHIHTKRTTCGRRAWDNRTTNGLQ
jgi:hypothetical protein